MATKRMMAACMVIGVMVMSVLSGMGMMGAEGEDGNFGGGDGTAGDPYAIEDVWDLQAMADDLTAHYVLINDIDASDTINWNEGTGFQPVGGELSSFEGVLDGQGHSISNLTINIMDENVGLFGSLGGDGEIKRIDLENVQVNGDTVVGGLVGYCEGAISDCSATGTVSGSKWVGGLVGSMDGSIDGCSAAVSVVGAQSLIGGLVGLISGWSKGDLTNCTASGDVSGNDTTGGVGGGKLFRSHRGLPRIRGCDWQ